jgi:hypothetical protein
MPGKGALGNQLTGGRMDLSYNLDATKKVIIESGFSALLTNSLFIILNELFTYILLFMLVL